MAMAVPFPGSKLFDGIVVYERPPATLLAARAINIGWRRSDFGRILQDPIPVLR
jgi:hypothetical protein